MTLWNHLVPSQRKPTHPFTLQRHSETRHNTNRHRVHPKNAKHDIPGQRLVSGQQLPGKIGAIDPSGQLVALHASRSHPIKLSLMSSQFEVVGSQGRKLTADPLILVCTTSAFVRLLPRRAIKDTLIMLFVLSFQFCV